jgi:hypothetical protein
MSTDVGFITQSRKIYLLTEENCEPHIHRKLVMARSSILPAANADEAQPSSYNFSRIGSFGETLTLCDRFEDIRRALPCRIFLLVFFAFKLVFSGSLA